MATIRKRAWTNDQGDEQTAWQVSYVDQHGKRRRRQFRLRKEADAFLVRARSEVFSGVHTPDSASVTVEAAARIWLDACELGRDGKEPVEWSTLKSYRGIVRHHIAPSLGNELLSRLTTPRVAAFRDELLGTRSRAMSKKALAALKAILSEAQNRGLVAQNVARPVSITTAGRHRKPMLIPGKEEVRLLLDAADRKAGSPNPHVARAWQRYRALLVTAVFTGLRVSELRGLRWEDVDHKAGALEVRQRADELGVIGSVKSAAARRTVMLAPRLTRVLREWRLRCPPGPLVFPNWHGHVERYSNVYRRCWVPVCQEAGLTGAEGRPRYTIHHLRHFRASMLIASDANAKEVMAELGHSSIQMTFDVYGHLFPEDSSRRQRRAAAIEQDLIG
jgi:integrase